MKKLLSRIFFIPWMCFSIIFGTILMAMGAVLWILTIDWIAWKAMIWIMQTTQRIEEEAQETDNYVIVPEPILGKIYYMIYKSGFFKKEFIERHNSIREAEMRIGELIEKPQKSRRQKRKEYSVDIALLREAWSSAWPAARRAGYSIDLMQMEFERWLIKRGFYERPQVSTVQESDFKCEWLTAQDRYDISNLWYEFGTITNDNIPLPYAVRQIQIKGMNAGKKTTIQEAISIFNQMFKINLSHEEPQTN